MASLDPEYTEELSYYDSCLGTCITAVHEDDESIWLHLSDGSTICVTALQQGFDVEIFDRPEEEECPDLQ